MTQIDLPRKSPDGDVAVTLGARLGGQLERLCAAVGFSGAAQDHVRALNDLLGPAGACMLTEPPPSASFVSDDHTPAELSVTFPRGRAQSVRVMVEPGFIAPTLRENALMGMRALQRVTRRWGISTEPLHRVEDLFLPSEPQGRFALWCALDLRRTGVPGIKVYLNPLVRGPHRAPAVVGEALARLGHGRGWAALVDSAALRPGRDELMFFSVDLGPWDSPRVKVYMAHRGASAEDVEEFARLAYRDRPLDVARFCREAGGSGAFDRRPLVSCLPFTGPDTGRPSGHTVHVPVRDYLRDDREARDRAAAVLRRHRVPAALLDRALAAMTPRELTDGVGLIAYLSLVRTDGCPPRLTVYFSPEAYHVRAPRRSG